MFDFWVHKLKEDKFFLSKERFPENLYLKRYEILESKMFRNKEEDDYLKTKTVLQSLYGINNVRSDEEPEKELCYLKRQQFMMDTNIFKKRHLEKICDTCGNFNHFDVECNEEENILGHYIGDYKGSDDEDYVHSEDDEEEEEEIIF